MGNGDEPHEGGEPSRVRVLPSDGVLPLDTESSKPIGRTGRPPWGVPLVVGLVALGILLATFGGRGSPAVSTTQAPSIRGFEDEYIDLRPGNDTQVRGWDQAGISENAVRVTDLAVSNNFVVTSDTGGSPAVWISTTGGVWREPSQFQPPESEDVSIDHAVDWDGNVIALGAAGDGTGIWRSDNLYSWDYEEIGEAISIDAFVAGPRLLVIGTTDDGSQAAWVSHDGSVWTRLGELEGLDGVTVNVFATDGRWYYAGGAESCATGDCRPVVYRSTDGMAWEATTGTGRDVLAAEPGAVRDIAAGTEGVYAVGTGANGEIAVWHSADGSAWNRIAGEAPELSVSDTTIKLISTRPGANATADITIDEDHYTVGIGSRIATLSGEATVKQITETGIDVGYGESVASVALNGSITIPQAAAADHISVHGRRILMAGTITTNDREVPAAWTSIDSGQHWQLSVLAPTGGTTITAAISKKYLVVVGTTPEDGYVVWHTAWDTSEAEADGLAALQDFVRLLNEREVDELIGALPEQRDAGAGSFSIPSLGAADLGWWDGNGDLDRAAVADTVDYLDAMNTDVQLDDCTAHSMLTDPDTIVADCAFSVSSDLLAITGFGDHVGRIEATLPAASLETVAVRLDPYTQVWATLQMAAETVSPTERATLLTTDELGRSVLEPRFDGETAAIHLEIARQFAAGQLRPGGTATVATALGTMEWQWLDLPVPVDYVESIAYLEAAGEFVLIGHGETDRLYEEMSVWTSRNGLVWQQRPGPTDLESIWDLRPIGDELVGEAWAADAAILVFFDGTDWSRVTVGTADSGTYPSFDSLAVSGDTALAILRYWSETEGLIAEPQAWLVGPDRTLQTAPPPPHPPSAEYPVSVSGTDDGYILAVIDPEAAVTAMWHSEDGMSWSLLNDAVDFGDAQLFWGLQSHFGRYYLAGEAPECEGNGAENECRYAVSLWSSSDGAAWDRVTTSAGQPLGAQEIGSGPLGLVAIGQPYSDDNQPRSLYLSADGTTWEQTAGFTVFDPTADWWWTSRPSVGTDTILIPGSSFQETTGADRSFLLVGRIVDQ